MSILPVLIEPMKEEGGTETKRKEGSEEWSEGKRRETETRRGRKVGGRERRMKKRMRS